MSRHDRTSHTGSDRAKLYDKIIDKIIAELEAGRFPWARPGGSPARKPRSVSRATPARAAHSVTSILILCGAVIQHGFPGQGWLTYRKRRRSAAMCARASAAPPDELAPDRIARYRA
ncbi:ArdC-like ssDNA-binding domain-containing protein [Mesorhizobium sp. 1B3]|uniref:ArdC-like ssDNA-binding domain-containing protein n=1 Tax=Mesorhizobium sp. 1B3 TaxID=3243599 RepID=UPI003D99C35A